jgi:hypothetical protein
MRALLPLLFVAMPAFAEELPANCAADRAVFDGPMTGAVSDGGYGETKRAVWLDPETKTLMEIFSNPQTGTATILRSFPNGTVCIDGVGVMFQTFGQGKPA